ncbi:MAG: hypothetical protein M3419_00105 [Actinomycetota bacterium]|nr:hypothetical protein [Actinomycetota bacterium]
MTAPPTYPRTPHLEDDPDQWLGHPVDVEEKLDGANVAICWEGGRPRVMSRGGPDAMDAVSAFGSEPMEGVVLRDSTGRRAKVVRTGFRQRDDTSWRKARIFNTVLA